MQRGKNDDVAKEMKEQPESVEFDDIAAMCCPIP